MEQLLHSTPPYLIALGMIMIFIIVLIFILWMIPSKKAKLIIDLICKLFGIFPITAIFNLIRHSAAASAQKPKTRSTGKTRKRPQPKANSKNSKTEKDINPFSDIHRQ